MSITVDGVTYRTLLDDLFVDGRKIRSVYVNGELVYPETDEDNNMYVLMLSGKTEFSYTVPGVKAVSMEMSVNSVFRSSKELSAVRWKVNNQYGGTYDYLGAGVRHENKDDTADVNISVSITIKAKEPMPTPTDYVSGTFPWGYTLWVATDETASVASRVGFLHYTNTYHARYRGDGFIVSVDRKNFSVDPYDADSGIDGERTQIRTSLTEDKATLFAIASEGIYFSSRLPYEGGHSSSSGATVTCKYDTVDSLLTP